MADPIEIITAYDLVSYPGAGSPTMDDAEVHVFWANQIVTEAWADPADPVPYAVRAIALEVASRVSRNPRRLESWTKRLDDASKTERVSAGDLARAGYFLTPEERMMLAGKTARRRRNRYGTIRLGHGY